MNQRVASTLVEYQGTLESYLKYRQGMPNGLENVSMTEIKLVLCDRIIRGVAGDVHQRAVHVGAAALIAERRSIASRIAANDNVSRDFRWAVKEHCDREALHRIADWVRYQCSRDGRSTEEWANQLNELCSKQ